MNIKVSNRLNLFPEYIFSKLNKAVAAVEKESGKKVLNFGAGSPDIPPSEIYQSKYAEFVQDPKNHLYPGYGPIAEFKAAMVHWHKTRYNVDLLEDEVYQLNGAKDAIALLPLAFLDEGDEMLTPDPGYQGFTGPSLIAGGKVVYYDLLEENDFKIDLQALEKHVSAKTKYIWINFPSNPTGQVATLDELKTYVDFAKKHNIVIVYDNAYAEITFDEFKAPSILQVEGAKDVAVELHSFSKTFSFAGYRMGWIVGNREVIAALAKIKSQMDTGTSLPLQKLGAYALTHFDETWHQEMIATYAKRREVIAEYLTRLGLHVTLPKGSLYLWAKIPDSESNADDFCKRLLEEKQILLTPGSAFGKNNQRFVRASICVDVKQL